MARAEYFPSFRRNKRRERQIAEIARRIGAEGEFASVVDYALAYTLRELVNGGVSVPGDEKAETNAKSAITKTHERKC